MTRISLTVLLYASTAPLYAVEEIVQLKDYVVTPDESVVRISSEMGVSEWDDHTEWSVWNPDDAVNLLEQFPNISINEPTPGSDESLISIRDSNQLANGRTLVLLDGFLLSNLVDAGAQGAPPLNIVDPQSLESLEVLYGPYSAEFGGYALGGVVSYETKAITERSGRIGARYLFQDFDLYGTSEQLEGYRAEARLEERIGKWGLAISASQLENEGQPGRYYASTDFRTTPPPPSATTVSGAYFDRDPQGDQRITYGSSGVRTTTQSNVGIKVTYDLNEETTLRFTSRYSQRDTDADAIENFLRDANGDKIWSGPVTVDGKTFNLSSRTFGEQRNTREEILNGIGISGKLPSDWNYDLVLSAFTILDEQRLRSNQSSEDPSYDGTGSVTETPKKYWLYGKAKATKDDFLGNDGLSFLTGYEWNHASFENSDYSSDDWKHGDHAAFRSKRGGESELNSGFAELGWQTNPDLKIIGGLRLDDWTADSGFSETPTGRVNFDDRSATELSPKFSVEYQVDETNTLLFNAARAYRFPLVLELYQTTRDDITGDLILSNPNLEPEHSDSFELSWMRQIEKGSLRLTVFHNQVTDAILSQFVESTPPMGPPGSPPPPAGRRVLVYENIDSVETNGIEFAVNRRDLFIKKLSGTFSISYMDSEIKDYDANPSVEGNRYPGVPEWRANGSLRYQVNRALEVATGARYQSHVYELLDNSDTRNTIEAVSERIVFDLSTRYRLENGLSLNARIDNLFNEVYFTNRPESQRMLSIGADWRF